MLDKDEDLLREFREEAQDILTSLEELLLQNTNLGSNSGVINELFRGVHTIKGSAGFLKQNALAEIAHALESVLGAMREGYKPNVENIQDLFLGGLDHLKKALYSATPAPELVATLNALIEQEGPKKTPCKNEHRYRIAMDLTYYENQGARSILNLINVLSTGGDVSPLETGMAIQDLGHQLIQQPLLVFFSYCSRLQREEIINLINSPFIQVDEVSEAPEVLRTAQEFPQQALSELTPGNLQPLGVILQWIELQLQQDPPKPPRKKILEQIKKIAELLLMGECEFQEGLNWMQPLVLKLEQPSEVKPVEATTQSASDMTDDSRAILEKFLQNHLESLEQLEHLILNWEKDPKQHVSSLKRYLHTLKGESGALGFDNISMQLHLLEQALEDDTCTADQLLSWRDSFRAFLQECTTGKKDKTTVTDKNMEIPAFVQENSGQESLRVSTHKVDSMLDAIGEAVIAQSMIAGDDFFSRRLTESTEVHKIQVLRKIAKMEQILRQIQELSMSMRMVNLKSSFQKMKRMVRDLSKNLNKELDFITEGEDTELDKTVVDEMGSILVHLVRNAMDHGLENPEERIRAGKNPKGRIILKAMHKSGNVVLMIADDGKGMDPEKLREKALSMGIVEAQSMRPEECLHLIFLPGFSTAQSVTDVSGRGVGMDVVRQTLEKLGGTIDVKSNLGSGTSFTLKLPINLAIMSGIVIRLNAEKYIIPTLSILETVQITKQQIQTVQGTGTFYALRGQLTKVVFLHHIFNDHFLQAEDRYIGLLVEDAQGRKCLLMCDEILDQQQVVIKKIQSDKQMAGFAGGAIMKDGTVSLIVDTNQVLSNQLKEEA